jgi:hypothetical protein
MSEASEVSSSCDILCKAIFQKNLLRPVPSSQYQYGRDELRLFFGIFTMSVRSTVPSS